MTFRVKTNFSFNFFAFLCNVRHYEKTSLIWLTTWNLSLCNWYYLGILPQALPWLRTYHVLVSIMIIGFAAATMTSWMTAASTLYCQGKPQHAHCAILNYRWNILTMQLFNTSCYVYNRTMAVMQCATVCLYLLGLRTDQRLQFHVCTAFFLSFFLVILTIVVLLGPYCLSYSSPSAIELCSVLFLLVLRLARNSTSTECWEFRTGWQACTTTPTLPAGFTQWSSIHLLSRTQRKLISH